MCKTDEKDCCKTCAFWKENQWRGMASVSEELITGECHRNPPSTDGHLTFFPTTKSTDWCGEHKDEYESLVKQAEIEHRLRKYNGEN